LFNTSKPKIISIVKNSILTKFDNKEEDKPVKEENKLDRKLPSQSIEDNSFEENEPLNDSKSSECLDCASDSSKS
jgi:hypothetical protein